MHRARQPLPRFQGEPRRLPGQLGDDKAALDGQLLDPGPVQRAVRLPQRLPQLQEPPALPGLGAQQQVRRPGRQRRAAGVRGGRPRSRRSWGCRRRR
ncbi:hypothetical protein ABT136_34985, partial [Streptomyces sp. NPDC001856]|uniref:hypothetical protein n=1 Tax=Streptomyces sp. NPDC001856 TaxID=3154399 RepID=UPI0033322D4B